MDPPILPTVSIAGWIDHSVHKQKYIELDTNDVNLRRKVENEADVF